MDGDFVEVGVGALGLAAGSHEYARNSTEVWPRCPGMVGFGAVCGES